MARKSLRNRRAFTFIELSAVIFILALIATSALIRLSSSAAGDRERAFRASLERLALTARQTAIGTREPVELRYEDGRRAFVAALAGNAESRELSAVTLPEGVEPRTFTLGDQTSSAADWRVRFFSDGTCDGGSVSLLLGSGDPIAYSLDPRSGEATVTSGEPPAREEERWPAGEFERRGGG